MGKKLEILLTPAERLIYLGVLWIKLWSVLIYWGDEGTPVPAYVQDPVQAPSCTAWGSQGCLTAQGHMPPAWVVAAVPVQCSAVKHTTSVSFNSHRGEH